MTVERKKSYLIYEISEDGLLKRPQDAWCGGRAFNYSNVFNYSYDSKEEAWQAIEKETTQKWTSNYKPSGSYIVLCEYTVRADEE